MDRDRDGGEGWMVHEWRALTLLVEWKVLALTLIRRTPMANLISSLRSEVLQLVEGEARAAREHPPRNGERLGDVPVTSIQQ